MAQGIKHIPTPETREKVLEMSSFGISRRCIADILDINEDTLYTHYKQELETSTEKMIFKVAKTLFEKAVYDKDVTSMIFMLKTRGRWRTVDNESVLESNEKLREEMLQLRKQLDEKNKKEY
jgi:hypothetical protein